MAAKDTFKQGYSDAIEAIKQALAQGGKGSPADQDFPDINRKLNPPPVGNSDGDDDSNSDDDNKNNSKSASSNKDIKIGDHGDPQKQAEEEAQRQKEGSYDPAKAKGNSKVTTNDADYADQPSDAGKYANDPTLEDRIKQIKDILSDPSSWGDKVNQENVNAISKEKAAKAAKDADRYRNSPLSKFKASLAMFIKTQTATGRGATWRRPNRKYADSELMRPGTSHQAQTFIPIINVYFDMSGSWTDEKIKVGEQAIATLNEYVHKGEIKINLFYFACNVHENRAAARAEGGTWGQPILDHIKATKPTNVIVMTDSDIDDCSSLVTVPGAVWFLFKGGVSENIIANLRGKTQTRRFEI